MKKFTEEQEAIFNMLVEEAEIDVEKNGTISWEEFWKFVDELEEDERRERKYIKQNAMKLRLAAWLGKISRKFIKA